MPVNYYKGEEEYPKLELYHASSSFSGPLLLSGNEMETIINLYLGTSEWVFCFSLLF